MLRSILLAFALIFMVGCAQHGSTQATVGELQTSEFGRVVRIEPVTIKDDGKGAALGGTIGAATGSVAGENKWTRLAGTIGGMVVGKVIGAAANSSQGERITLEMDDGRIVATELEIDKNYHREYQAGDRVAVFFLNGGVHRIERVKH